MKKPLTFFKEALLAKDSYKISNLWDMCAMERPLFYVEHVIF